MTVQSYSADFRAVPELFEHCHEQASRERRRPQITHVAAKDRVKTVQLVLLPPFGSQVVALQGLTDLTAQFERKVSQSSSVESGSGRRMLTFSTLTPFRRG